MQRKPSHFGSYCQRRPSGSSLTDSASIGSSESGTSIPGILPENAVGVSVVTSGKRCSTKPGFHRIFTKCSRSKSSPFLTEPWIISSCYSYVSKLSI